MKIAGALLVFVAGYLLSRQLMEPSLRHLRLLEEGEFLFRIMESEIRNSKKPLPELFYDISQRTESLWKVFFFDLSEELKKSGDLEFADEFERLLTFHLSSDLTQEEMGLFFQAGRNLLSDDLLFHKKAAEQLSEEIQKQTAVMQKRLENQKKVYQAVCLSMSALLVIILL